MTSVPAQKATARLRKRAGSASRNGTLCGYIEAGSVFYPVDVVTGEEVSGNSQWFELEENLYAWSGASTPVSAPDRNQGANGAGWHVKRRPDNSIDVLSAAEIDMVFGKFDYTEAKGGAIAIDPSWVSNNIVSLSVPILDRTGFGTIKVHKKAKDSFAAAFAAIERAGLEDLIKTCAGTWVPRHKGWNPQRTLSSHSWGIAIDLNAGWNGYGCKPAGVGQIGCVPELIPYFEAEGFGWGGYFQPASICDGMHFELARLDL